VMEKTPRALEIRGLTIRLGGRTIVDKLELLCSPGTITVLTGANGSGKTTVLNALNGLMGWDGGHVVIAGHDVRSRWTPNTAFAAGVRRTFQVPRNWPSLDLAENIAIVSERPRRVIEDQLHRFLPNATVTKSPATLSLGQRRVLEVLRLLLSRGSCKVALLDEPMSGLDATNASVVARALSDLLLSGAALLIVDHEPNNWPQREKTIRLQTPYES
jgi:ABC-type branched-subunit amino acid transport system ATPase component